MKTTKKVLIFTFFFMASTALIILLGTGLRKICLNSERLIITKAEEQVLIKSSDTIELYSKPNLEGDLVAENLILKAPAGYFLTLLQEGTDVYKVNYNGVIGFIKKENTSKVTTSKPATFFSPETKTESYSSTYIRSLPSTDSNKLSLVPPETSVIFLGFIEGSVPSDGTSNMWYYIEYDEGPTTTHRGYIYSERCTLSSPIAPLEEDDTITSSTTATTNTPLSTNPSEETLQISISSGLKWFLIILFSVLALIVFILLLSAPKSAKREIDETPSADNNPSKAHSFKRAKLFNSKKTNLNPRAVTEFSKFEDFSDDKNPALRSFKDENKIKEHSLSHSTHQNAISPKQKSTKKVKETNSTLSDDFLRRFFSVEHYSPDSDHEPL